MARRERNAARRPATREQRPSLLVVCGAEKTEIAYFEGLRSQIETKSIDLLLVERPAAPDQIVAYARDFRGAKDFDERWCVVDVDRFEREGGKVSIAFRLAAECEVHMAVSNPCFEFWLLLHHAYRTPPAIVCKDIENLLRGYVPGYDKRRLRFPDFAGGLAEAVERGKKIDPTGMEHSVNPSSGMWRLVERIRQ